MEEEDSLPTFLVKSTTNSVQKTTKAKTPRKIIVKPIVPSKKVESLGSDPLETLGKDIALHILSLLNVNEIIKFSTVFPILSFQIIHRFQKRGIHCALTKQFGI